MLTIDGETSIEKHEHKTHNHLTINYLQIISTPLERYS